MSTLEHRHGERSEAISVVVDTARAALQHEFAIAERLDSKARNQVTVAGSWFALVGSLSALAIKEQLDGGPETFPFSLLVVLAGVHAFCLIVTMLFSYGVWRVRTEKESTNETLEKMLTDARTPDVDVAERVILHYGAQLARRRANNKERSASFKKSVGWWIATLSVGLMQFVAALFALAQA